VCVERERGEEEVGEGDMKHLITLPIPESIILCSIMTEHLMIRDLERINMY
jgi:hypothetical protein